MTALTPDVSAAVKRRQWQALLAEHADRVAILSMSKDQDAKLVAMLFDEGVRSPVSVAKVPTTRRAERQVMREVAAIERVRARVGPALRATIPEPLAVVEHQGRLAIVLGALDGAPGLMRYHSWHHTARPSAVHQDFMAAAKWLDDFQSSTSGPTAPVEPLLGVNAAIAQRFSGEEGVEEDLARVNVLAGNLRGYRAPRTAVHGDFWFGNLLFRADRVTGVVDWEMAVAADGEPVHDLARFVVAYSLYLDRHARPRRPVAGHPGLRADFWGAGVEWALDGGGWYPELVHSFLGSGLRRLGVPAECGRDVVLAELATIAALADDEDFGRKHLHLLRRLMDRG